MHRLQELVRLHRLGLTERRAAKELRIGRNTAKEYRRVLSDAGVLEGSTDELPTLEVLKAIVLRALPPRPAPQQVSKLEEWQPAVEVLLEQRLGPQAIHDRLRLEHPDYQGSIGGLKRMVRRIRRSRGVRPEDVRIPVDTEPGDVIGDARHRLVVALAVKEFSDLVGHVDQPVRRHERPPRRLPARRCRRQFAPGA